mmetsp:Transcript_98566/g.254604  ORF Transcript_98566/g.254604 Transcript_98566/m.254604 type:complete len:210 (-) Transcript_98566:597-1226(-)
MWSRGALAGCRSVASMGRLRTLAGGSQRARGTSGTLECWTNQMRRGPAWSSQITWPHGRIVCQSRRASTPFAASTNARSSWEVWSATSPAHMPRLSSSSSLWPLCPQRRWRPRATSRRSSSAGCTTSLLTTAAGSLCMAASSHSGCTTHIHASALIRTLKGLWRAPEHRTSGWPPTEWAAAPSSRRQRSMRLRTLRRRKLERATSRTPR